MIEWITSAMDSLGYIGVAALMFLENLYPPIPSEVIMPLAGFVAKRGEIEFMLVVVAGTAGSVAGAVFWYYVGKLIDAEQLKNMADRYGKWLTISRQDINKALGWFERHGKAAIFLGRMVPAVRTLISIPAGIAHMRFSVFLIYTIAGSFIWTGALAYAGLALEQNWKLVENYVGPISTVLVGLVVLYYFYRLMKQRNKHGKESKDSNEMIH